MHKPVVFLLCLILGAVNSAVYEYKNVELKSLYLKYRTGFILLNEEAPGYIDFNFAITLKNPNYDDLEDKLVQITVFSVDALYSQLDEEKSKLSLTNILAEETYCCADTNEFCFQPNTLYCPLLSKIEDSSETFFFDFERGDIDQYGNFIVDASGLSFAKTSGLYAIMFSYCEKENESVIINGVSTWKSAGGLLPAEWFGYLNFYGNMALVYLALALVWGYLCFKRWRQLLLLQNWITFVLIISMVEIFLRYSDYHSFNEYGVRNHNLLLFSLIFVAAKKAISRMLVLVVVTGFGVIRPNLGTEKNRVLNIGSIYFGLALVDSMVQNFSSPYGNETHSFTTAFSKLFVQIPLALLDLLFLYWTFKSLGTTILSLEKRGQTDKLLLFKRFRLILKGTFLFSVLWTITSFFIKLSLPLAWDDVNYNDRFFTWDNLYLLECAWDVLYLVILVAIMGLWLPSERSLKYAYTSMKVKKDDEFVNEFDDNLSVEDTNELKLYKGEDNENEAFIERETIS